MFRQLDTKILLVIGTAVTLGLTSLVVFYSEREERNILAQNQRTLLKLVDSTRQGLKTLMLSGYADVGPVFAEGLKGLEDVAGVVELGVIRPDGSEAFVDNRTINRVNRLAGYEQFYPREEQAPRQVLAADQAQLQQVLDSGRRAHYYGLSDNGERLHTLLAPVHSEPVCRECHREERQVLGVIKLTTSLAAVDRDISMSRFQSLLILVLTVLLIMAVVRGFVARHLLKPITTLNRALQQVSGGNLDQALPTPRHTELAVMAGSFNRMTRELAGSYARLQQQRNTLTTIIQGAREGMIITDEAGRVVLVNPAAETLLSKGHDRIRSEGFEGLFDDPGTFAGWLEAADGDDQPLLVEYNGRVLSVQLATIEDSGRVTGSAALIRDITDETRLRRQLHLESQTDTLTGLYNRRYLDQQLTQELGLAHRYGRGLALVLFDVDHFKAFNDQYGHECGDRVLRQVATVAQRTLRRVDILCRYGGEEFLVIMPELNRESAAAAAETLRQAIAAMVVEGRGVTASFGIALEEPGQSRDASAVLKAADQALYRAKRGGRNRVEVE